MIWLPFHLHPEYPPEGVPRARLEARYGKGFLDAVRGTVESAGFVHAPPPFAPNSLGALKLGEAARDAGRHEALHPRLFHAYWSEGADIGDAEVLVSLAEESGLDADTARGALKDDGLEERVRASTNEAARIGANGVPAWLIDQKLLVVGAQPHEVFDRVLDELGYAPIGA